MSRDMLVLAWAVVLVFDLGLLGGALVAGNRALIVVGSLLVLVAFLGLVNALLLRRLMRAMSWREQRAKVKA